MTYEDLYGWIWFCGLGVVIFVAAVRPLF